MNEVQKLKRKFRQSKEWKSFRNFMKKKSDNKDAITLKPLRKGFQVHHQNLDETKYNELIPEHFICVNNLTHKFIHWCYGYYVKDPAIIDRLKTEMELMAEINKEQF